MLVNGKCFPAEICILDSGYFTDPPMYKLPARGTLSTQPILWRRLKGECIKAPRTEPYRTRLIVSLVKSPTEVQRQIDCSLPESRSNPSNPSQCRELEQH